jgi:Zn finger protein HypA/HybF involved in hydrogenase expression
MGVIGKAKEKLGLSKQEYRYECHDCDEVFTSTIPGEQLVRCPECGSENQTKLGEVT